VVFTRPAVTDAQYSP